MRKILLFQLFLKFPVTTQISDGILVDVYNNFTIEFLQPIILKLMDNTAGQQILIWKKELK